ncbi:hypothetical protein ACVBEJ_10450 [Porticoccus sp. GXU_MW_L64]
MTAQRWNLVLATVLGLLLFPLLASWLESRLFTHVLVEIPLLVFIGFMIGRRLSLPVRAVLLRVNAGGINGVLVASFVLAFWMIPRWLDASLGSPLVAWAKYLSLVVAVGIPLALSWPQMHVVARAVVKIEFLTMLFRLGWIYLISPQRLCNNYLLSDQVFLGQGCFVVGITLIITWLIPVFSGSATNTTNADKADNRPIKCN